jgi:hypothetical protein
VVQNPFVQNHSCRPFVQNPFVQNPFVQNPVQHHLRGCPQTRKPPYHHVPDGHTDLGRCNPNSALTADDGTTRQPRPQDEVKVTRAFRISRNSRSCSIR